MSAATDAAPLPHAREAAICLTDALAATAVLHEPGQRERYRLLLERAIESATRALAVAVDLRERAELVATLVGAHAAKAEDALHGAGQLSLSAQRAPTREACDDGWRRVAAIVAGAEQSARLASSVASELEAEQTATTSSKAARAAAARAVVAARTARKVVDERNHAYTFHTDRAFSFGEGWYLAAAAVLSGVTIQIEPGTLGTAQAQTFLRDVGLAEQLQSYRSRPRGMKQTTELVGRAFAADPVSAQRRLREAFLGDRSVRGEVRAWVDARLSRDASAASARKVLVWSRDGVHHPGRNTRYPELHELTARVRQAGLVPVLTGDALRGEVPEGALDMILFWKDALFMGQHGRRAQLEFFEHLRERHGLVGQVGVTTAGMDGPALLGIATIYLTDATNVRMREWVGRVPGYEELVREGAYLERVSERLSEWARTTS